MPISLSRGRAVAACLLISLSLAACGGSDDDDTPSQPNPPGEPGDPGEPQPAPQLRCAP
ncbi:hypothetical protein [Bordetella genomosp. 13]|uniref:hypothetical protein n=1 Tax=Bordetella genomosp. 13 TaxID=463040 RepID=UPI0018DF14D5|nr:hypothetical protein [Bordetella genomosp. 13]